MRRLAFLVSACAVACAAPLNYSQPAEVVRKGEIQVAANAGLSVSTATVDLFDVARAQAQTLGADLKGCGTAAGCVPMSKARDVVAAFYRVGVSGLILPAAEVAGAYGVSDRVAVGARLGSSTQRLHVDARLLDGGPARSGLHLAAGLGYAHQSAELPGAGELGAVISFQPSTRHTLDAVLVAGTRLGEWGWVSAGARYLWSRFSTDLTPQFGFCDDIDKVFGGGTCPAAPTVLPQTDEAGIVHGVGGFASVFLGYRWVWLGLELAASRNFARARILGVDTDLSATQLQPTMSVLTRF